MEIDNVTGVGIENRKRKIEEKEESLKKKRKKLLLEKAREEENLSQNITQGRRMQAGANWLTGPVPQLDMRPKYDKYIFNFF